MPENEPRPNGSREDPRDALGYAVAAVILVVGGAIARTPILNWIVGPTIVVVCANVIGRLRAGERR